ncbi:MAG: hypothetical protein WC451_06070 [Patescibacteria group bacterium]|jgi:hypothetical protein
MNFLGVVSVLGIVIQTIIKAIPFVEELFKDGADKKAAVVEMAQIAVSGVADGVIKNNPNWDFIKPMAEKFIDDVVAAANAIEKANKS